MRALAVFKVMATFMNCSHLSQERVCEEKKFMGKTYKILMLVENLPVPADPRVWKEATTLRDAGYQVSIICPKGSTRYREAHTCIEGIHIYRYQLPASSNKYMAYLSEFGVALLMTFWL